MKIIFNCKKALSLFICGLIVTSAIQAYDASDIPNLNIMSSGLNDFSDSMNKVLPNSAVQQNVWAEAWIGKFLPSIPPHFGAGINSGVTKLDTSGLKDAGKQLGISGIPSNVAFPTLTADARIGGIILPFDVGFTFTKLDTSTFGGIESAIDPLKFDFYSLGIDARYAIIKGGLVLPKVSIGAGYVYTSGSFKAKESDAHINMDMKSQTAYLQAQASKKILFLVPFVGGRAVFSKTETSWDWGVDSIYTNFLNSQGVSSRDSGKESENFRLTNIQPQIFGGIGIDLMLLNITLSGCYDAKNAIPSGAFSLRLAL